MPPEPQPDPVSCPGCGRGYAAARLAGGRTLHCACGARVGVRLQRGLASAGPPRFVCDVMLGGLARRLRSLGYDALWHAEIADHLLVAEGVREGRWILTRDRRLAEQWWVDSLLLLRASDPLEQLREVASALPLSDTDLFTRCSRCNLALQPLPAERAAGRAPPEVLRRAAPLAECRGCGRVYWEGSHTARMRRALREAIGAGEA